MKTNVGIELTDEERLNLGQKYYKKNKAITRADLNVIVKNYIKSVLTARPYTLEEKQNEPYLKEEWSSLSQFKEYLQKQGYTVISFDGFKLIAKDSDKQVHSYTLGLGKILKD
jgi:hypothetical protein